MNWLIGPALTPETNAPETKSERPWWIGLPSSGATTEQAIGLPALLGVLRLLTGGAMMMPLNVYRGEEDARKRARDTWQWDLLHNRPTRGIANASSAFRADSVGSLAASGKLFIRKLKARNRVGELIVLDPRDVTVERKNGLIVFHDSTGGNLVDRDESEIIYIRTFARAGSLDGVSPITAAREAFEAAVKRQLFELNYYKHDGRPGIVIKFGENVQQDIAESWLELWNEEHEGVENAWKASVLGGGAELETIPVSAKDAMFVEQTQMTTLQILTMYQIPLAFGDKTNSPSETDRSMLVTFGLGPYMQAIDEGLSCDRDLFEPVRDGGPMSCALHSGALLRPDFGSRMTAKKNAIQGAIMTPNEARADEDDLPPHPDGDRLQFPVVGGGPNDPAAGGANPADPNIGKALDLALEMLAKYSEVPKETA